MFCMYVDTKKLKSENKSTGGKLILEITRPSELAKGVDMSLGASLTCWYCKDSGHELRNCKQLQYKLAPDHLATLGIKT